MFLRKKHIKSTGRTYLYIAHGFRDTEGNSREKSVMPIGYLDELIKEYDDPIAHFEELAAAMDEERKTSRYVTLTIDMNEQINRNAAMANRKNYGHVVFSKIYHELELDIFLKNARRHKNFVFNTDAIMRLLVYSRLLHPCSKRATVLNKEQFFDNYKFSLDDVYDALTHFNEIAEKLQQHLHTKITQVYGRNTELVYYDVTNYHFEIDQQDDLRRKGAAKNFVKKPIVQMGLLLDKMSLPITYKLFPGNTHDSQTLIPILTNVKKTYGIDRIIVVADKALNSGDNIAYNTILGDGYIYSKSVRGASEEFKNWVLDETGYREISDKYKLKSKLVPDVEIDVTTEKIGKKKKKKTVKVEQKWVVFYSEKYAVRAKRKREEAITKALDMIKNPSKYRSKFDYGAIGYIENIKIDKETGEISNLGDTLSLNEERIKEEEKFDGYYAISSSELDDTDEHIIDMYRGLWRIEESFKVTKSILEARPIYLRTDEHINAHFLICFITLLIGRIVEMRLGGEYTIGRIAETLRKISASNIDQNLWLFNYADEITDKMNAVFGTDFGRKNMTLMEIRKSLGMSKKTNRKGKENGSDT
jgi:transposase